MTSGLYIAILMVFTLLALIFRYSGGDIVIGGTYNATAKAYYWANREKILARRRTLSTSAKVYPRKSALPPQKKRKVESPPPPKLEIHEGAGLGAGA